MNNIKCYLYCLKSKTKYCVDSCQKLQNNQHCHQQQRTKRDIKVIKDTKKESKQGTPSELINKWNKEDCDGCQ